ncbi:MAG: T9SS type A sorting domain-containing protein [Candidatus Marinimicrobia bacterium]|nr:T9SS type A sorting domain-containing protein [Candidatus Neomarinimicrobiota bacterium]MCF7828199.1 T9SS type A sorting domain-containing protein [Candidatus Neomarinimicrobiota bacterium]MCF7879626.1 T9SS type A sorting domain-containing protein [Candidatus Neomarinimicrobiota bacterium]
MKLHKLWSMLIVLGLLGTLGFSSDLAAKEKGQVTQQQSLMKMTQTDPIETVFDINNMTIWSRNDGYYHWSDPFSGVNGTYPKGLAAGVVFAQGTLWGGIVDDGNTPEVRVNGSTYNNGMSPGKILPIDGGIPTGPDTDRSYHAWRVRTDYETADLSTDASQINGVPLSEVTETMIQELRAQYERDWNNWPAELGAPYEDVNNNGTYEPSTDIPGYPGADQTIWYVANDLPEGASENSYGSPEIGMEVQTTIWGYNFPSSNPLGNMAFIRSRLIYRGDPGAPKVQNAQIDSMYIVHWVDPDVGTYDNDFAGSDTSTSMGFAYSGVKNDPTYFDNFGLPSPAVGWDFLQGPIVNGDTLGLTSFSYFAAGSDVSDPDLTEYQGTLQWYNLMRGYKPRPPYPSASPWVNSVTGENTKYVLTGDPVAGEGWIDGMDLPPGDRRIVLSSGPFTMAQGDTQDVVVGQIAAMGQDNISSISVLRSYDEFAQYAYDNNFNLPSAPAAPQVETVGLDKKVVLNWGSDKNAVDATENTVIQGFNFQGYNIYQLPSPNSQLSEGEKIATFDKQDSVLKIFETRFDIDAGRLQELLAQEGTNSGIQRTLSITRDRVRSRPVANGVTYHFALTAYSYNPDSPLAPAIRSLESSPTVVSVTPQPAKATENFGGAQGDTVEVQQVQGTSDGVVTPIVVNPHQLNGHTYQVTFDTSGGQVTWNLIDQTTGEVKLSDQTNQSGNENYLIVDGMMVKVSGPEPEFSEIIEVAYDGNPLDSPTSVWHSLNSTSTYYLSAGGGGGGIDRLARSVANAVPRDYELRFTSGGSDAVWYFDGEEVGTVPFELWDIGQATPNDPSDDTQLIPLLYSGGDGTPGTFDIGYTDPTFGYPATDWVYWYGGDYAQFEADVADGSLDDLSYLTDEYIARMTIGDFDDDGNLPPNGTTVRFVTAKPNTVNDVFEFTAPETDLNDEITDAEIDEINVFPNPYYGRHRLETGRFEKYVTFTHLPQNVDIRIFNLGGVMVREINHNAEQQFQRWDLTNQDGLPVGSGIYIAHITVNDADGSKVGEKVLKLAIIQEEEILPVY